MTREEILRMPAGREMDALIAEKVMGHVVNKNAKLFTRWETEIGYSEGFTSLSRYSTDIRDAWEVVEKFPVFYFESCKELKEYFSMIGSDFESSATAETAPLSICRSALLYMEGQ